MSVSFIVLAGLFEAALIAALTQVRRLWRGEPNPYDRRSLQSQRTAPMLISSGAILVPLVLATGAMGDTEKATTLSAILVSATLLWLFGGGAVALALWTTGRPAALVPPHLRRTAHRR